MFGSLLWRWSARDDVTVRVPPSTGIGSVSHHRSRRRVRHEYRNSDLDAGDVIAVAAAYLHGGYHAIREHNVLP